MFRTLLILLAALLVPAAAPAAGERIAGANTYMLNEKQWRLGADSGFWILDNYGTYEVSEGPLEPGAVECHGSGYWDQNGVSGEGICIYGAAPDQHFWSWVSRPGGPTRWRIVHGTGRFAGATGEGVSSTRSASAGRIMPVRITDWEGEIEMAN